MSACGDVEMTSLATATRRRLRRSGSWPLRPIWCATASRSPGWLALDDGLDLLVSPHDGSNVLPAMAGLQVRAGPSQRGLKVGRHEAYWRDHNLPVFGVVLTDPTPEHPVGGWCDAREYLRRNPRTKTIPTHSAFPGGFAQALSAACDENRSLLSALDLFDNDWRRQATAAAALAPLCTDPRVAELLGSRLGAIGPRATHYALTVLLLAEQKGADTHLCPRAITAAVDGLCKYEVGTGVDLDAWHDGTDVAYRLLELRRPASSNLLDAALSASFAESTVMLLAMAVSLAGGGGEGVLREALKRVPNLAESPDVAELAQAVAEGGYTFSW